MFCNKLRRRIKEFTRKISSKLIEYSEVALNVTTVLKKALDSPIADVVTAIIPGQWDDVLKENLRIGINYAMEFLQAEKRCNNPEFTLEQKIECFVQYLKTLPTIKRDAVLIKFASLITQHMDSHEQKQHVYDALVQLNYSLNK